MSCIQGPVVLRDIPLPSGIVTVMFSEGELQRPLISIYVRKRLNVCGGSDHMNIKESKFIFCLGINVSKGAAWVVLLVSGIF